MNIAFNTHNIVIPYNMMTVTFENNQDKTKLEANLQTNTNQTTA